ncbi:MAG: hypothetical protein R3F43_31280 [bacterium]
MGPLATFPDGNVFLRPFLNGAGWTSLGGSTIYVSGYAGGSPVQERGLNNINLHVHPTVGVTSATFACADFGGNINMRVNGGFISTGDLSALPPIMGGAAISSPASTSSATTWARSP